LRGGVFGVLVEIFQQLFVRSLVINSFVGLDGVIEIDESN
jgi:hypothetical protein